MAKGKAASLLNDPKPGQFDVPPFTVSNWADQVGLAVAIFSGSAYYLFHFVDALPGAEFQDWITSPFSGAFAWDKVSQLLLREGSHFSRDLSMLYVRASGSICGLNIPCLNFSAFLPVGLSAGLLYVLGRNLGLKPIFAVATVLF